MSTEEDGGKDKPAKRDDAAINASRPIHASVTDSYRVNALALNCNLSAIWLSPRDCMVSPNFETNNHEKTQKTKHC
jgi:hypothetical protein